DEGWFSGVGFHSEDDAHFEVGDDRINAWADRGLFGEPSDGSFDGSSAGTPSDSKAGSAGPTAVITPAQLQDLLITAMNELNVIDNELRAGIAAIAAVESNFLPRSERGYSGTSVARIRKIFPSRVRTLSDEMIEELKSDDKKFFNFLYGGILGNDEP